MSKQVALAFCRRVLAKCHKFEDSGISCFSDPALRDIVYAPPRQFTEMELLPAAAKGKHLNLVNCSYRQLIQNIIWHYFALFREFLDTTFAF